MRIIIYPIILDKLQTKHGVSANEVEQAFLNRSGGLAKEVRPQNQGDEERFWFISTTDEPNDDEVKLYEKIQRQKKK